MSFISFGFVNIIQQNDPLLSGPLVNTTLTNKVSGPALTERKYLEALKYRKPPPLPPKLTAKEAAQAKLDKAQNRVELLRPSSFYGSDDLAKAVAERVRADLKRARKDRDHEYFMEIVNKEWAKFKKK